MTAELARDEADWEQWFSDQYELNDRIDRAIAAMTVGKLKHARAALYAAVCEHAAERMRINLDCSQEGTP